MIDPTRMPPVEKIAAWLLGHGVYPVNYYMTHLAEEFMAIELTTGKADVDAALREIEEYGSDQNRKTGPRPREEKP